MTKTELRLLEKLMDAKITAAAERFTGNGVSPSAKRKRAIVRIQEVRAELQGLCGDAPPPWRQCEPPCGGRIKSDEYDQEYCVVCGKLPPLTDEELAEENRLNDIMDESSRS